MKEFFFWLGIVTMIVLGVVTGIYARDYVWLLIPGLAIFIAIFSIEKLFR